MKNQGKVTFDLKGSVGTITISRPGKKNSLTGSMLDELADIVKNAGVEADLRVLVIKGNGNEALAAGVDLSLLDDNTPEEARTFSMDVQSTLTSIEALPIPVIAAVSGFALGGGLEIALACDVILASENAMLALPEVNLGIIPGWGGSIRLPRRVGLGRAKDMIFSGRTVKADEALAIGLVEAVYPADEFEDRVQDYAALLTTKSSSSLALAKSTIQKGLDASLEAGLALEREAFAYCFALPDAREGVSAFLEKRKPKFR